MRNIWIVLVSGLLVTACVSSGYPDAQSRLTSEEAVYRLGADDKVRIRVFEEPELTGTYSVDSQGKIALPLVGNIDVTNKTEAEAADAISRVLQKKDFIRHPKVSVETANMRPFFVMGEVGKPGEFPFKNGLTVYQAVAVAGGYSYRADRDDIAVRRQTKNGPGTERRFKAAEDTPVLPGDVIEIGERYF